MKVIKDYTIKVGGEPQTIRAYDPGVPGLVIHRAFGANGWVVTHKESGGTVSMPLLKRDTAKDFCDQVAELTDWTQPQTSLAHRRDLYTYCRELSRELRLRDLKRAEERLEKKLKEKAS